MKYSTNDLTAVIISGPKASGKTRNKNFLKRAFRADGIIDNWIIGNPVDENSIHLTYESAASLEKVGFSNVVTLDQIKEVLADKDRNQTQSEFYENVTSDIVIRSPSGIGHKFHYMVPSFEVQDGETFLDAMMNAAKIACDHCRVEFKLPSLSPTVKFRKAHPDVKLPNYESVGAAGADIRADLIHSYTQGADMSLAPTQLCTVPTGLFVEVPPGYEMQVRPRSGLAAKNGITVLNSPGTIDSDYRGEIKVILLNTSDKTFHIQHGMRIAQIVIAPVVQANFVEVADLTTTDRGTAGFGSTGIK